mmetsp:Transcript_13402/g.40099  ORF Transcript_13402/g.40099 Transcript_13402/m.40099 type:complete len:230 (+) Transcript_13402:888-1577(+)
MLLDLLARGEPLEAVAPSPGQLAANLDLPSHVKGRDEARRRLAQQQHDLGKGEQRKRALGGARVVEVSGRDLAPDLVLPAWASAQLRALAVPPCLVAGRAHGVVVVEGEVVHLLLALVERDARVPARAEHVVQRRGASLLRPDNQEAWHAASQLCVPSKEGGPLGGPHPWHAQSCVAQPEPPQRLVVREDVVRREGGDALRHAAVGPGAVEGVAATHLAARVVHDDRQR